MSEKLQFVFLPTAPPVFTKKPASETYPKAKWIYMDCEADGIPKPKVTWLQNGLPVVFKSPVSIENDKKNNDMVYHNQILLLARCKS